MIGSPRGRQTLGMVPDDYREPKVDVLAWFENYAFSVLKEDNSREKREWLRKMGTALLRENFRHSMTRVDRRLSGRW